MDMKEMLEKYPPRRRDFEAKMQKEKSQRRQPQIVRLPELDLHGFTKKEAEEILVATINRIPLHAKAKLRILHGKGNHSADNKPVLPALIDQICRSNDRIKKRHHPPEREGGTGVSILSIGPA